MVRRREFLSAAALMAAAGVRRWNVASPIPGAAPVRVAVVGDCLFTQRLARTDPQLPRIREILRSANVTVGNFEGTLADDGTWASPISCGGMNIRADSSVAGDLAWLGFDMMGAANNHSLDWGEAGVLATIRKLSAGGIANAGLGKDLPTARKPAYSKASGVRTAIISCSSTFRQGALASRGNASGPGRPGLSPVRFRTTGTAPNTTTAVEPRDLREIVDSVKEARQNADLVCVSCHTHESAGDRLNPPEFLKELARACVDAGSSVFFSHGPHVLRGIELYKGTPIFYSLGAFIFRARETRHLPEEMYENCQVESRNPLDYFERTSRSWSADIEFWESVIAQVDFEHGKVTGVSLTPTVIQHATPELWGMPALADAQQSESILARLKRLSEAFGTTLEIDGSVGRVSL